MASPEFGVTLPFSDVASFAAQAERLGYDYLTSGDHVAFHSPQANAFVTLGVAAGATERIQLLSAATLLPLYPAALVAKMAATLDVASNGRFNLGVGIGGEYPAEFEACGVPVKERGARANEALPLIRRLLAGETVSFDGRFNHLHDIAIQPPPLHAVPIWVAGRKEGAMRRAARYGDVWMPYMYTPEQLAQSMDTLDLYEEEDGRPARSVRGSIFAWAAVGPDEAEVKRQAAEVVSAVYRQDFSRLVDRYFLAGSPASVRRRIQEYVDAGATAVLVNFACPAAEMRQMLQRFALDVIPEFRPLETATL